MVFPHVHTASAPLNGLAHELTAEMSRPSGASHTHLWHLCNLYIIAKDETKLLIMKHCNVLNWEEKILVGLNYYNCEYFTYIWIILEWRLKISPSRFYWPVPNKVKLYYFRIMYLIFNYFLQCKAEMWKINHLFICVTCNLQICSWTSLKLWDWFVIWADKHSLSIQMNTHVSL